MREPNKQDRMARYALEKAEDWDGILKALCALTAIQLPEGVGFIPIPPFGAAVARFLVRRGKAEVSVYLDWYEALGFFGAPHWEIYPDTDDNNMRFALHDTAGLTAAIVASLDKQEPACGKAIGEQGRRNP
jgi:hypothetical protein